MPPPLSRVVVVAMRSGTFATLRDGTIMWTVVTGTGPPLVCCHGGPGLWDYLEPLAFLLSARFSVIRFEQRGCGRSTGVGPFTIAQAVADLDQLRSALGIDRWAVLGHSWGAELALRYAARHPGHTSAVVYISGVGAGEGFRAEYVAERDRRLGNDRTLWQELGGRSRTPAEEHTWCLLQWRPDFSPTSDAIAHAEALWSTRPPDVLVNTQANRELWADRDTEDLLELARTVTARVEMIFGDDDPRPWTAAESLYAALPQVHRTVLVAAGHAPWAEQPSATRDSIFRALTSQLPE
jgi:proline iminopeptidase